MGRTTKDANLDTKEARFKLERRDAPYWHRITEGCFLGYLKGKTSGTWIAKRYDPNAAPARRQTKLGVTDDTIDADGELILTYAQAHKMATDWFPRAWSTAESLDPSEGNRFKPYTLEDACRDYLREYEEVGKKDLTGTRTTINAHILIKGLREKAVSALTYHDIKTWHRGLAKKAPRRRTSKGEAPKPRKREDAADVAKRKGMEVEDVRKDRDRARKASANRILTVLKAVLNFSVTEGIVECRKDAWSNVLPFPNTDKARARFLTTEEQLAIVKTCGPNLRTLVQAAMFTGARYGELARLKVQDFNAETGLLYVTADTKTYTDRYISLSPEAHAFFRSITEARPAGDRILHREENKPWGKNNYSKEFKKVLKAAATDCPSLEVPPTFHEFRHTYASGLIQGGAHLMVVAAQLGHKTTLMVEKHYGHLRKEHVMSVVQAKSPILGITNPKLLESRNETSLFKENTESEQSVISL